MGLISNLLKNLFGGKEERPEKPTEPTNENHYLDTWEKEREKRITAAEARLKDWVIARLKEKGSLAFSWESGNDEAFVTFQDKPDTLDDNFEELEEYIVDKLDIPDAGEFQMNGHGTIYLENNSVKAKYSSSMKALIDFNEKTEEEIYSEEIHDSGDKLLFSA